MAEPALSERRDWDHTTCGGGAELRELLLIGSLRSDYFGRLQDDRTLFEAGERTDVPPLPLEQIGDVVLRPVAALGARFDDPEIVPIIADATARDAGSLPLMFHMMEEAWGVSQAIPSSAALVEVARVAAIFIDRAGREHRRPEIAAIEKCALADQPSVSVDVPARAAERLSRD